ncbi:hypothetical protein GF358_04730 [Candidatus Woesearchaeota archaeon]|nr:hypothetical protein [Candidatus Woesearchaeota archaeon]
MGTITALQISDIHDKGDLSELEALVSFANETKPDVVVAAGDLSDGAVYQQLFLQANKKIIEAIDMPAEEKELVKYQQMHELVSKEGEEKVREHLQSVSGTAEEGEQMLEEFKKYLSNKENIAKAINKFQEELGKNKETIAAENKKVFDTIKQHLTGMNTKLGEIKSKKVGVRGNHDSDYVYKMNNLHWLEKDGPAEINGITFAGAPNTYEAIAGMPQQFYSKLEDDVPIQDINEFIKQFGTNEDLEEFKQNNPVYQRLEKQLQGKSTDFLVTHKGIGEFSQGFGYGAGLALWVKDKIIQENKSPIILSGHIHGDELYSAEEGYQGLRSSNQKAYIMYIDSETKKIKQIDVYKKVYETIT